MKTLMTFRVALLGVLAMALIAGAFAPMRLQPPLAEARMQAGKQAPPALHLDPNDTVVLLLDHQTGLFQTVKDIPVGSCARTRCSRRSRSSPRLRSSPRRRSRTAPTDR